MLNKTSWNCQRCVQQIDGDTKCQRCGITREPSEEMLGLMLEDMSNDPLVDHLLGPPQIVQEQPNFQEWENELADQLAGVTVDTDPSASAPPGTGEQWTEVGRIRTPKRKAKEVKSSEQDQRNRSRT